MLLDRAVAEGFGTAAGVQDRANQNDAAQETFNKIQSVRRPCPTQDLCLSVCEKGNGLWRADSPLTDSANTPDIGSKLPSHTQQTDERLIQRDNFVDGKKPGQEQRRQARIFDSFDPSSDDEVDMSDE